MKWKITLEQIKGDLINSIKMLTMNPETSGAGTKAFSKQGSYINVQTFFKGGYGCSVKREMITTRKAWRQRPLRSLLP
jgi:hypothetical protein